MNPDTKTSCVHCQALIRQSHRYCGNCGHIVVENGLLEIKNAQKYNADDTPEAISMLEILNGDATEQTSGSSDQLAAATNGTRNGNTSSPTDSRRAASQTNPPIGKRLIACPECWQPKNENEECRTCKIRVANEARMNAERERQERLKQEADRNRWTWDDYSGCLWTGCAWTVGAIIVLPLLISIGPFVALVAICALVVALIFAAVFKK